MIRGFRSMMALVAVASLAACNVSGGGVAGAGSSPPVAEPSPIATPPAGPAAESISTAFRALDAARSAVDVLLATKQLLPGSPRALAIADGLDTAKKSLLAASAIERSNGNPVRLMESIDSAIDAMRSITALLTSSTGAGA